MKKIGIIILSAGLGTRLRPITNLIPKALIEINNKKKVIDYAFDNFENLKSFNKEFLVNTFYKSELLSNYLKLKKNIKIKICKEKKLRGSLGTLYDNIKWIKKKDIIILQYGDVLFNKTIKKTINLMIKSKYKSRMIVDKRKKANKSGVIKFNSKKELISFIEKPKKVVGEQFVNSGLYVFDNKFLLEKMNLLSRKIDTNAKLDFSYQFSELLLKETKVFIFKERVMDIGDQKNLSKARLFKWS